MSDTATRQSIATCTDTPPTMAPALNDRPAEELNFCRMYLARAVEAFPGSVPDLDLKEKLRKVQRTVLRIRAAKADNTPDLFLHESSGALWVDGLNSLAENARQASFNTGARVQVEPDPDTCSLQTALSEAGDELIRFRIAIEGNGSDPMLAETLTSHFYREPSRFPRSRPSAIAEIDEIITAIRHRPEGSPDWLDRFIPRLERAKRRLKLAYDGRQKPTVVRTWSDEVQIAALALELALNDFLGFAATTASSNRFTQFVRVIAPHQLRPTRSLEQGSSDIRDKEAEGAGSTMEEEELDAEVEDPEIGPED